MNLLNFLFLASVLGMTYLFVGTIYNMDKTYIHPKKTSDYTWFNWQINWIFRSAIKTCGKNPI